MHQVTDLMLCPGKHTHEERGWSIMGWGGETKWVFKRPTRTQYLINVRSSQSNSLRRAHGSSRDADALPSTDSSTWTFFPGLARCMPTAGMGDSRRFRKVVSEKRMPKVTQLLAAQGVRRPGLCISGLPRTQEHFPSFLYPHMLHWRWIILL